MKPAEIKAELNALGYTIALIAEILSVNPSGISQVINRHGNSYPIANAIAKILNKPIEVVFPDIPSYTTRIRCRDEGLRNQRKQELQAILANN